MGDYSSKHIAKKRSRFETRVFSHAESVRDICQDHSAHLRSSLDMMNTNRLSCPDMIMPVEESHPCTAGDQDEAPQHQIVKLQRAAKASVANRMTASRRGVMAADKVTDRLLDQVTLT